ncbi:MAG: MFS transporter [Cyanobacteria bacterium Co-bin8]|nr:MFS transporter [Cyanobacteria bacterium Co-bin8]
MIGYARGLLVLEHLSMGLAQVVGPGVYTPEQTSVLFSGPQFFIALISGLVLTFGFQLLLTNLSVAAGISWVGHSSSSSDSSDSGGTSPGKIGTAFGVWTLITVSLALFFACLLAIRLSLYTSALMGAITGLVIWGTYFCLLFWVSSTTVGSMIGSIIKTATSGFQSLVGTATSALGAKAASNQVVATAEAAVAAVRRELTAGMDTDNISDALRDYLSNVRSPEVDIDGIESEFERLVEESRLSDVADRDTLRQINRDTFVKLVDSRTDLSRKEINRIADRLYRSWQKALMSVPESDSLSEMVSYLKSARPEELVSDKLNQRIDQVMEEMRRQREMDQSNLSNLADRVGQVSQGNQGGQGGQGSPGLMSQGLNTLMAVVMGRADLSDLDVEKIIQQFKSTRTKLTSQANTLASKVSGEPETPFSVVRADVENYLLNTYPWQMRPERLRVEFRTVIYDSTADANVLRQELERLNRSDFVDILKSRGLLTPEEIKATSLQLEAVRKEVLQEVVQTARLEAAKDLQERIYTFLRFTPRDELLSDMGENAFKALMEDSDARLDDLEDRFSQFNRELFVQILRSRPDLGEDEVQQVASRMERVMNQVMADAQGIQEAARTRVDNQWQSVQDYLRNTGRSELNPEGIKSDLQTLLHEPDEGARRLQSRLANFDHDTLVELLKQRPDLSEAEAYEIADQVESNWYRTLHAPAVLTDQAKMQYDQATNAIADYLRNTGKPELSPEGIQRDLQTLMRDPKLGASAIRNRLASMDRDTLVQLLSQRQDMSQEEVNQTIDQTLESIRSVVRAPKRLARRTQSQVLSFEQAMEDYLRNTDKEALNPDGIKRDLNLLLSDPRLGAYRMGERLSMIDRDTLVALLAQRPDMTREEAEAAVDRVLSVRDQIVDQIKGVQERVKALVLGVLGRIRNYLNSLDRPELNYESIQRDVRRLFDDPQAGFDALRMRLSQFDRDTLVAVVSSHDAISESDVNRVLDQIEGARVGVLQKAERLEQQVEERVRDMKLQAQRQVEETRKAAEAAAWWIFGTAAVSAVVSAIAGSLAVSG